MDVAVEESDARAVRAEPEILEVVGVAHVGEVRLKPQPVREIGAMPERRQPPVVAREVVARQVVVVELAAAALRQVAVVNADSEAAARKQERRERQVVVRREVVVIRHADLEAALVRVPERREQEAGLAQVADRKRDDRRIEDRDALEVHADIASLALLRALVDVDAGRPQLPVGVAGRAGREAHVAHLDLALVRHLELARGTARGTLRQLELGARELAGAECVPAAGPALQADFGRAILDVALDLEAPLRGVVGRRLGGHLAISLGDRDAARELGIALARHLGAAALDLHRKLVRALGRRALRRGCGRGRRRRAGHRPDAFAREGRRQRADGCEQGDEVSGNHGVREVYNAGTPAVASA